MKPRVMVVDDEDTIRNLLKSRLEREGYDVATAASGEEAMQIYGKGGEVGVIVTDLRMPGKDGFELMKWAKGQNANVRMIMITGHGEKECAIQALREGGSDYLEKPFDMDELKHSVDRAMSEYMLKRENTDLVSRLEARVQRTEGKAEDKLWYVSKANSMSKVNNWLNVLRREALRGDAEEPSVLILGESGTGKEGIARMIHAGSRRARGPWVAVNCANFNEQLLESELFGHERGAFTGATNQKRGLFEIAKGGTLFLDEIGEMDVKLQAKLLRVVQEKVFRRVGATSDIETDVRVVAATNQNLEDKVRSGAFREDLYHRVNRVVIEIPPLRNRTEDVVPMAKEFIGRAFQARGKAFSGFAPEAEETLRAYSWPGNVRELLNVVERTALIWEGTGTVTEKALGLQTTGARNLQAKPQLELVQTPYNDPADAGVGTYTDLKKKWCDAFEREYLSATLVRHHGNVSAASREAHLDRSNFLRLLRRHGIKAEGFREGGVTRAQPELKVVGGEDTGTPQSEAA